MLYDRQLFEITQERDSGGAVRQGRIMSGGFIVARESRLPPRFEDFLQSWRREAKAAGRPGLSHSNREIDIVRLTLERRIHRVIGKRIILSRDEAQDR